MSQGYDKNKPAYLDALESLPIRTALQALSSAHRGATAPTDPEEGWFWLDVSDPANYRLKMYLFGSWVIILNNLMGGFPTQSGASKVVHTQSTPSTTWTINHNTNDENPVIQFWDSTTLPKNLIIPNNVQVTSANQVVATFSPAQAGTATILT